MLTASSQYQQPRVGHAIKMTVPAEFGTHTTRRQNHSIWFLTLLTHLYILFLFNNIRQFLESKQALPLINLFLFLPLCLWEINKGDVLHAETFQGNKISLNNHKRRMWIQSTKVYRTSNKLNILLKASHFDHTATVFPSNYSQTDIANLPALQCSSL